MARSGRDRERMQNTLDKGHSARSRDIAPAGEYLLHYAFDQWVQHWRKQPGRGAVVVVRYADDSVMGFEKEQTARAFLADLRERLAKFALVLHPDKTRLIEFGRFASDRRRRKGEERPETF